MLTSLDVGYNDRGGGPRHRACRAAAQQADLAGPCSLQYRPDWRRRDRRVRVGQCGAENPLHIGGNKIDDEGAAAIAERRYVAIRVLTNLNLGHNNIGPEGAKAIGEALAVIKTDTSTL